jgi:hypothetical protein
LAGALEKAGRGQDARLVYEEVAERFRGTRLGDLARERAEAMGEEVGGARVVRSRPPEGDGGRGH